MNFTLSSKAISSSRTDCLVVAIPENGEWPESTIQADEILGGRLKALQKNGDITGKNASTLMVPASDAPWARVLVVGTGNDADRKPADYRKALAAIAGQLKDGPSKNAVIALTDTLLIGEEAVTSEATKLNLIGRTLEEQFYSFTEYKSEKPAKRKLVKVTVVASGTGKALKEAFELGLATGQGMNYTRDLGNTPPNICHPVWLAEQAKQMAKDYSVIKTEVLDEKQMEKLGMNTILAVGKGSAQPPRLIVMEYRGGKSKDKPYVLVGKGITFDTGGISLKPGEGMDEMKYDMGGSAAVFGAMKVLAETKPKINVVAVIAAAENMPDGNATRPGDIVKTLSGQTVEILNTDAEGRLVLCDALTYVKKFDPETVIDMATLTGACIIALGHHATGLLSNNDELAGELLAAGERTGDRAWRLPLWDEYQGQLDSNFADMQNIGGRPAGTITAACFLSRFAREYRWAHLDIAGTAWNSGKAKGSTGRPVPLLVDYLMSHASK
ncbi:aminopeptidase A. Metallo peptidase. MEROPS family M17 [Marinobacter daqiaonensis]|uniref:Probable cytosol aminopeptidase n=1 Tax=Marinobacter daqiaonensis TaxID=650891 RepID=A0A1I6GGI3_9GAMM|nr:leucyl aminopeptidase [Marinobacter daqiaonensis]SFR41258.1 aminopeptidase A. Metallo peptidase. MEROPS family M17 [Marinobacter daqiaonensis]